MAQTPIIDIADKRTLMAGIQDLADVVLEGAGTIQDLALGDTSDNLILTLAPVRGKESEFRGAVQDLFDDLTTPFGAAAEAPLQTVANAPEFTPSGNARIAINAVNPELLAEVVESMTSATATAISEPAPALDMGRVRDLMQQLGFDKAFDMGKNNVEEPIPFRFGAWEITTKDSKEIVTVKIHVDDTGGAIAGEVEEVQNALNAGLAKKLPDGMPVVFAAYRATEDVFQDNPDPHFILEAGKPDPEQIEGNMDILREVVAAVAKEAAPHIKELYKSMDQEKLAPIQEANWKVYIARARSARERAEAIGEEFDIKTFRESYLRENKGKNMTLPDL